MTDKNSEFIRFILGFILVAGTVIGGAKFLVETKYREGTAYKTKIVREYFDGFDRLAKTIFSQFD